MINFHMYNTCTFNNIGTINTIPKYLYEWGFIMCKKK
jgi:hypothetical protein